MILNGLDVQYRRGHCCDWCGCYLPFALNGPASPSHEEEVIRVQLRGSDASQCDRVVRVISDHRVALPVTGRMSLHGSKVSKERVINLDVIRIWLEIGNHVIAEVRVEH